MRRKLTLDQAREIRRRASLGELSKHLAIDFGVSEPSISRILAHKYHREPE